jgi:MFS family permease
MISHEFEAKQRGTAFGVFGAVIGLAFASGPLIGGSLITAANWRWIFFLNIPVGILAILVTALRVRHSRDARARGVDLQGLLMLSAALTALVLGLIRAPDDGWTSAPILTLGTGAAALLVLFVLVERRRGDAAMLDLTLFRNRTFIGLSAVALLTNVAGPPSIFLEANFVENILHLTPWQTGVRFLPLTCTILVFGAIAGGLTSVVPVRLLLCLSAASIAGGLLLVRLADQHSSWTVLLPSMIVTGIGMGMFNPPRASTAILVADPDRAGMASGASETFQQIGIALGIAAIGSLFEHQVTENFVTSPAGVAAANSGLDAHQLGRVIASGGIDEVTAGVPAALGTSIRASGEAAFMHGFSFAFLVLASVCALSAVVALLLIRQRDLRQGDELYAVAEDRVPAAMET